jgi:hypothetical protein
MYSWTSSGVPRITVMYSFANHWNGFTFDSRISAIRQPITAPKKTVMIETTMVVCVPRRKYA